MDILRLKYRGEIIGKGRYRLRKTASELNGYLHESVMRCHTCPEYVIDKRK